MTIREFYQNVIDANLTDEMTEFAQVHLSNLDATNEKRREKNIEKAAAREVERAPIRQAIVDAMTNEFKTATTLIADAGVEVKPQAIPSLLKALVADGFVVKGEVKVAGKGKQVGYALAE